MAPLPTHYYSDCDPSYFLHTFEQEHCTGYECCDIKLDDMHAVMEHYETIHRISRFGNTSVPVPRLPAVRHQPIVTPLLPVAPQFDFESELASAASPASTAYSERAGSLGSHDDDEHLDKGLDTAPQTPAASPSHSPFNVTIVGTNDSPDGFNFNPMYQIGSPIVGTRAIANCPPKLTPAYPIMGVPQPPLLSVAQRQVEPTRQAAAMPPFNPHSSMLAPGLDVEAVHNTEVEPEESYYQARSQPASAVYPLAQQLQVPRPQIMRQNSMHSIPSAIPALTPARSHSVHVPSREPSFTPRPVQDASQQQRPLVPSPSPSDIPHLSPARMHAVRIRTNGSAPFPQAPIASAAASPSATAVKRSFDEMDGSDSDDEDAMGEEDDEEDAEGEPEQGLSPAMQALVNRPAVIIPRDSKGQGREKRAKTGRPKGTGRASAQKDPKRAKLFCPRPGCTKRYMNPNGLKYHLEKGTCTIEV
ncbi:hypothetical protein FRC00_006198 [Tulasnella sp. 408]|nr:hypothetical protein FRC00_006198 [Tulasnella sp. 408]